MSKHRLFNFAVFIIYIVGMTALMIWQGIGIAPDRYAFVLLLAALLVKKTRAFLLDWIPFLFILISYDFLRGFADNLDGRVHFIEPINWDKFLFLGKLPTVYLQNLFYHPSNLQFYDYLATMFYFLHFALPLAFGFLIWMNNRTRFREFVTSILILSYSAWITYIVFPSAPPWMAGEQGYIQGVSKILDKTLQAFPEKLSLPTIYHNFNPNPVAAIPSLHAAYPFLILILCVSYFGKKGLYFIPYVLGVWISIVYLGEHYVSDILIGAVYAAFSYILAIKLLHNVKFRNALVENLPLEAFRKRSRKLILFIERKFSPNG